MTELLQAAELAPLPGDAARLDGGRAGAVAGRRAAARTAPTDPLLDELLARVRGAPPARRRRVVRGRAAAEARGAPGAARARRAVDRHRGAQGAARGRRRGGDHACSPRTSASCCWPRRSGRRRCWASIRACAPGCKLAVVDALGQVRRQSGLMHLETPARQGQRGAGAGRPGEEGRHRAPSPSATAPPGARPRPSCARRCRHFEIDVPVVMVSEAGASVYSASDVAREEFPELDVTVRGAISIARRLQDPLAELVKIDPKSIGVGQYQHDVSPTRPQEEPRRGGRLLREPGRRQREHGVVPPAGARVGHRPGAGARHRRAPRQGRALQVARRACWRCRASRRRCSSRRRASCACPSGANPLDNTGVHPERYAALERLAARARRRHGGAAGRGRASW